MPDEHDYSADKPQRSRPRENFEPDDRDDSYTRPAVPKLVRTAGIIWIIFGCLIFANAAINLAISGTGGGANFAGVGCGVLFGIAFLYVGMQSIKGTATDTLGNSVGSIIIGVLNAGVGVVGLLAGLALYAMLSQGNVPVQPTGPQVTPQLALMACIGGGVSLISGAGLIVAGTLALMGRADYKAYRRAGKRSAPIDD